MPTEQALSKPSVKVNAVARPDRVTVDGLTVTVQDTFEVASPATIQLTVPAPYNSNNYKMRYTLNGKNPTLGSALYSEPITIRKNGNGFSSDNTVLKVKGFANGRSSETVTVRFRFTSGDY